MSFKLASGFNRWSWFYNEKDIDHILFYLTLPCITVYQDYMLEWTRLQLECCYCEIYFPSTYCHIEVAGTQDNYAIAYSSEMQAGCLKTELQNYLCFVWILLPHHLERPSNGPAHIRMHKNLRVLLSKLQSQCWLFCAHLVTTTSHARLFPETGIVTNRIIEYQPYTGALRNDYYWKVWGHTGWSWYLVRAYLPTK